MYFLDIFLQLYLVSFIPFLLRRFPLLPIIFSTCFQESSSIFIKLLHLIISFTCFQFSLPLSSTYVLLLHPVISSSFLQSSHPSSFNYIYLLLLIISSTFLQLFLPPSSSYFFHLPPVISSTFHPPKNNQYIKKKTICQPCILP